MPATVILSGGAGYTVSLDDKKGYSLVRWSSGETSTSITVTLSQNMTLIAFYKPLGQQTLRVIAKLLDGKSLVGVGLDMINSQSVKTSNTIPENISASFGQTYTIVAKSTSAVLFKYWNGNLTLTNASLTTSITGNTTAVAYFQQLPFPYKHSGTGNHTITVIAHTPDGGLVVGAYFQVRINGVWNHVADGYTPASVTVPAGNEELVMYHCAQVPGLCDDKFFVYRHYNNTTPNVLTRWQYLNLQSDMVMHSFYEVIPASEAVHVTIEAVNGTGPIFVNCTCGSVITIANLNGTPIAQSLEPYSFWLWKGRVYTVTVGNLTGYTFMGWTTGQTGYTITFTAQPQQGASDPYYQYFAAIYKKN